MNWLKRLKGPTEAQTDSTAPGAPAVVDVDAHAPARWGMLVLGVG